MKSTNISNFFAILFLILLISSGCATKKEATSDLIIPAQERYEQGMVMFEKGKYSDAAKTFSKVFYQHPGAKITSYAELMEAYSHYLAGDYEDCHDVLENFILLHPMHPHISYAYYLKALSLYMQISNIDHDQTISYKTKDALKEVAKRFPETKYAIDAKMKIDLVHNTIAGHELTIGRYYQENQKMIGAINRYSNIVEHFSTTTYIAEALHRLVECYVALGLYEEAKYYAAILGRNYPNSKWYNYSYQLINSR